MIRVGPSGEWWEQIREFTAPGRYVVAVVRSKSTGHIRNVAKATFDTWPEATA
ncbi:hypothetical protein [Microbacterium sp. Leaf179]|uniref:hypothetical protein n=1 Tax=Microbacterium sp. Leaf179 TaxID=1736288 RepID=UPI000AE98D06|nr:hypothetical protein [Microbacterium sp. Leaf179]